MKVKVTLPDSLEHYARTADYISNAYKAGVMKDSAKALSHSGADVRVTSGRMEATIGKLTNRGVIDLKPMFMRSSKVKRKKNGGWYLVIPINISSRNLVKTSGRKTYDEIRSAFSDLAPNTSATVDISSLFEKQYSSLQSLTLPTLVPAKPTGNITATKNASGSRNSYVAFRTVSDRSAPQSWVINRKNITSNNSSKRLQSDVASLIRQRIRQSEV